MASNTAPKKAQSKATKPAPGQKDAGIGALKAHAKPKATAKAHASPVKRTAATKATPQPKKGVQEAQTKARARPGPASSYTPELGTTVCELVANGVTLRAIAATEGMPAVSTLMLWLDGRHPAFTEQYIRAREAQADKLAEETLAIADEDCTMVRADKHGSRDEDGQGNTEVVFDATAVARNRLRVDARKWLASKMAPKKYGDKLALGGAEGLPAMEVVTRELSDAERAVRLTRVLNDNPAMLAALLAAGGKKAGK